MDSTVSWLPMQYTRPPTAAAMHAERGSSSGGASRHSAVLTLYTTTENCGVRWFGMPLELQQPPTTQSSSPSAARPL